MILKSLIAAAMVTAFLPVAGARSQSIDIGPNGLRVNPPGPVFEVPDRPRPRYEQEGISEGEAVRIARREGLERVEGVRQGRRGWVVAGVDMNDEEIRVIISNDGEVVDVQRE